MLATDVRAVDDAGGTRWEVARDVDADPDLLWDVVTDPARWPEWRPTVGAVRCEDERIGRGTRGEVRVAGAWHPFTVETCGPAGQGVRRWTWRLRGVDATGHRVETRRDGGARVVCEVPLWAMAYVSVYVVALRRLDRLVRRERTAGE